MTEQPSSSNTTFQNRSNLELNAAAPPFEFRPIANVQPAAAPAAPVRSYASVVARDTSSRSRDSSQGSRARNAVPARSSASSPTPVPSRPTSAAPRRNPSASSLNFNFNPNAQPFIARTSSLPETPQASSAAPQFIANSDTPAAVIPEHPQPADLTAQHAIASDENHQHASSTSDPLDGQTKGAPVNGVRNPTPGKNGAHHPEPAPAPSDDCGVTSGADAAAAEAKSSQLVAGGGNTISSPQSAHDLPFVSPLAQSAEHMRQTAPPQDAASHAPETATDTAPLSPRPNAVDGRSDSPRNVALATDAPTSADLTWPPAAEAAPPEHPASEHSLVDVAGTLSTAGGDIHSALGDSSSGMLGAALGSGLTPRPLSQPMQQHERSVNRLRTVVHHEIVRALQRLTAMPIVGVRQQEVNGRSGSGGGEISLAGGVAAAGEQASTGGGAVRMEQAACMDHFVARAHADSITGHTHSAFQKVRGCPTPPALLCFWHCAWTGDPC